MSRRKTGRGTYKKKAKKIEREKEIEDYETIIMGMKIRVKLILLLMFHAQT